MPVYNAESKLARVVHQLLDVTSDLTPSLELIIVDDGSTDNTEEVAMDIGRQFPQVTTMRYAKQSGHVNAVRIGITNTTGDVVLIQNIDAPISGEAIRELWGMRKDEVMVFTPSPTALTSHAVPVMHSKPTWSGGTQMLNREAIRQLYETPSVSPEKPDTSTTRRVTRTDSGEKSASPTLFQQHINVEMQPDR